ncbi:MAG: hypothetical protein HC846_05310 [Blastocatellia bacterium]|nr:hypothetical protein [Blastocatellia bacterium]
MRKRLKEDEKQPVDAFEQALNAAQAELNRASKIQKDFLDKIKNKEITLSVDVEKLWNETGFGKYTEPITISYVEFEKFILYKAFQFYTETHCKVFIWGKGGYERVAENSGDFSGLSPASRKEIYKKFGKDWVASSDYPQINNISDLCRYWKPKIIRLAEVSDRPLSQRGGLF